MFSNPNTEIGRLQSEIREVKREIQNKVEPHEIHEVNRKLDSMECTLRNLSSSFDELQFRVQETESKIEDLIND